MIENPEEFRQVMRQWATGVTIVSVVEEGILHGMAVNSFTSLSLHPPLVLISLEIGTRTYEMLERTGNFGVTILSRHQSKLSDIFAGRQTENEDRFAGVETFPLISGAPMITGGLAFFDCRVIHSHPAGTHKVFIAEVLAAQQGPAGEPLIYFDQAYRGIKNDDGSTDP